jgi:tRNA(Arg) A34 adenosine deaminase TadA
MDFPSTEHTISPLHRRGISAAELAAVRRTIPAFRSDAQIIRELAARTRAAFASGHPSPFGAEIVETRTHRRLVSRLNQVVPENDPTCHAEVRTVRFAAKKIGSPCLKGYTLYSTCEPCPMCMTACLWAGLDRVVYGTVVRPPDSPHPPLFDYDAKAFAKKTRFTCIVDGPVEEKLCRALVDDPIVQRYMARLAKKNIFI